jgi:hypothetical protein
MIHTEETFERYLAQFQPRPIRKLILPPKPAIVWVRRLAAAALVVVCLGAGYRQVRRFRVTTKVIELKSQTFVFTRIGLYDSKGLDQILADQSRVILPNFQSPQSSLRVLARE